MCFRVFLMPIVYVLFLCNNEPSWSDLIIKEMMTRRIEDDPQTDTQTNKDNGTHTQTETGMIDKTNTDRHFLFQL